MHKLLILEYDHNQKIWYQNLAKKTLVSLSTELYHIMCACIMKTTTEENKDDITLY